MEVTKFDSPGHPIDLGLTDGALREDSASAHGAVDRVAASADEAARGIQPAIHRVAHVAHRAVDRVAGVAEPAASWLVKQGEDLDTARRNATADARAFVTAHPWQSIAIAMAAGFVVGRWAR